MRTAKTGHETSGFGDPMDFFFLEVRAKQARNRSRKGEALKKEINIFLEKNCKALNAKILSVIK